MNDCPPKLRTNRTKNICETYLTSNDANQVRIAEHSTGHNVQYTRKSLS